MASKQPRHQIRDFDEKCTLLYPDDNNRNRQTEIPTPLSSCTDDTHRRLPNAQAHARLRKIPLLARDDYVLGMELGDDEEESDTGWGREWGNV